jgi:hypothetical protein
VKRFAIPLMLMALVCVAAGKSAADQGRFFLRAGGGATIPYLTNLSNELELQRTKNAPRLGYTFAVSLGRTFPANQWSAEVHISASFYPEFDYAVSDTVGFPGHLEHYDYGVILRRNLLPNNTRIQPWIGAGIGLGQTNLINGGGKFYAPEAIAVGRLETAITDNINFAAEATYYAGLKSEAYKNAFLQNASGDVILKSNGQELVDRYRSFDVRIGITVYLKARTPQQY